MRIKPIKLNLPERDAIHKLMLPQDKANHFVYGFIIFILANLILSQWLSFGIVCIFAIGKEIFDQYKYKRGDYLDAVATVSPAITLIIKNYIIWNN
jgi:hypothetical protein